MQRQYMSTMATHLSLASSPILRTKQTTQTACPQTPPTLCAQLSWPIAPYPCPLSLVQPEVLQIDDTKASEDSLSESAQQLVFKEYLHERPIPIREGDDNHQSKRRKTASRVAIASTIRPQPWIITKLCIYNATLSAALHRPRNHRVQFRIQCPRRCSIRLRSSKSTHHEPK
ncbi:hypothetical protein P154DRAFT_338268 [Amniculicola lignicola CBS 123094]|uniref:Uncharacterized protein n=1 Tax=Amniculicola lignicola CBS 123094 TaxID=1392246 RepID=A0A6A5WUE5_9PLEO|nr:hypothetical protein P154DRAFT_338268 [Amniculicola lignicola CBS 123094]